MDIEAITNAWVNELATSPLVGTRRQLVREVVACIEPQKRDWLEMLADDVDRVVAQMVAGELSSLSAGPDPLDMADFEERFAAGIPPEGFAWEYVLGVWVPRQGLHNRMILLRQRDDDEARRRAFGTWTEMGVEYPRKGGVFIKGRRLVCEYTRSPRSMGEASSWKEQGRPTPPPE